MRLMPSRLVVKTSISIVSTREQQAGSFIHTCKFQQVWLDFVDSSNVEQFVSNAAEIRAHRQRMPRTHTLHFLQSGKEHSASSLISAVVPVLQQNPSDSDLRAPVDPTPCGSYSCCITYG